MNQSGTLEAALETNFFTLLGVPQQFDLDPKVVKQRARTLLRQYHPDRFSAATPQEQRIAVQFSSHINTAVSVLENPVQRATHLLLLNGVNLDSQQLTVTDKSFLFEQMDLRENIEEAQLANDKDTLEALLKTIREANQNCQKVFYKKFDKEIWIDAIGKMQFFEKLENDIRLALNV